MPPPDVERKVEGLVALVAATCILHHLWCEFTRSASQATYSASLRCDCRLQLAVALKSIAAEGAGILLYEQQEGRGIGRRPS